MLTAWWLSRLGPVVVVSVRENTQSGDRETRQPVSPLPFQKSLDPDSPVRYSHPCNKEILKMESLESGHQIVT